MKEEPLRLDLFLKRSRLVKRRPIAALLCQHGGVTVNGREAPPGRGVKEGDRLTVRYPREEVTLEVLALPPRGGGDPASCYRVLSRRPLEE